LLKYQQKLFFIFTLQTPVILHAQTYWWNHKPKTRSAWPSLLGL